MKLELDIQVKAKTVLVEPQNYKTVDVLITQVEKRDILDHFDLDDIVYHFEEQSILDHIGKDRVMEYFDLKESD
jgi:hypothetical protein